MPISLGIINLVAVLVACGDPAHPGGNGQLPGSVIDTETVDKVDPRVRTAARGGSTVSVFVLGSRQLIPPEVGIDAFAHANGSRARTELRTQSIAALRTIADSARSGLRDLMGSEPSREFWIVNGMTALLDSASIERVAASEAVAFIYPAGNLGSRVDNGGNVRQVLSPAYDPAIFGGKNIPWNLNAIGAPGAWEMGATGAGIVIGVFDGGVNYLHEDLRDRVWVNSDEVPGNSVDDDENGFRDDYYGFDFTAMNPEIGSFGVQNAHGTWVSGILVGNGSGGTVTGVAPDARIMPLRASGLEATLMAFEYALDNGADVINMSFSIPGLGNTRGLWRLAAEHAAAAGMVMVSGAGNFRQSASVPVQLRTPEDIPVVIAAGGVDSNLTPAPFSSMGPVEWASVVLYNSPSSMIKPDVAGLPGPGYPLLDPNGSGYLAPGHGIRGNSFSGPHVAGVVALVLSANPDLNVWEVKSILEETARDAAASGRDNDTGFGLVNAEAAVRAAMNR